MISISNSLSWKRGLASLCDREGDIFPRTATSSREMRTVLFLSVSQSGLFPPVLLGGEASIVRLQNPELTDLLQWNDWSDTVCTVLHLTVLCCTVQRQFMDHVRWLHIL